MRTNALRYGKSLPLDHMLGGKFEIGSYGGIALDNQYGAGLSSAVTIGSDGYEFDD